jgi:hypothetical protein
MCHLQEISLILDAGQVLDDLIPISRQDGGIRIGNAGQIMDDLIPMGRLEGDVLYRGCWIVKIWFSGLGIFN